MSNTLLETLQGIERHLKNISISLRVLEARGRESDELPISLDSLKKHYRFDGVELPRGYERYELPEMDSSSLSVSATDVLSKLGLDRTPSEISYARMLEESPEKGCVSGAAILSRRCSD